MGLMVGLMGKEGADPLQIRRPPGKYAVIRSQLCSGWYQRRGWLCGGSGEQADLRHRPGWRVLRNRFCQIPQSRPCHWNLADFKCYVPLQVRRSVPSMRDAISGLIGRYDQLGRYLDRDAIDRIDNYFSQASVRLAAVELINREATEIVREASQRLWRENPELILPGGNAYTTRRLAACLRDMDYFLRYASYALISDDVTMLDERVLNGLDDTYKSLGVPTGPTVRGIALLGEVVSEMLSATGISAASVVRAPFDHLCRGLGATNVRAR